MLQKLLCLGRYALLAALTISHLVFFGLPAIQKFQEGDKIWWLVHSDFKKKTCVHHSDWFLNQWLIWHWPWSIQGGVTTEERIERSPLGIKPPAVTLIPWKHSFYGWKNSSLLYADNYKIMCQGANSSEDMVSCVKNRTFSLEETVTSAYKGFFLDYSEAENLTGDHRWTWDLTAAWQGRCRKRKTYYTTTKKMNQYLKYLLTKG